MPFFLPLIPSHEVPEITLASRSQGKCRARGKLANYAFLLGLLGGILFFTACGDRKSSDLEVLPGDTYLQKPGDFLGNRYVLRVQINEQLKWE